MQVFFLFAYSGLTYLLTSVKHEKSGEHAAKQLLPRYLEKFPDCEHVLVPFGWHKEKRSFDVVRVLMHTLQRSRSDAYVCHQVLGCVRMCILQFVEVDHQV